MQELPVEKKMTCGEFMAMVSLTLPWRDTPDTSAVGLRVSERLHLALVILLLRVTLPFVDLVFHLQACSCKKVNSIS